MELGSLDQFLDKNMATLDENDLQMMCLHVARGMTYLHSQGILHNDLAARNVLVSQNSEKNDGSYLLKVSDFGLSFISEQKYFYGTEFTKIPVRWSALEVISRKKYSKFSDVWSFGVTCWEIYKFGEIPYCEVGGNPEVIRYVGDGGRLKRPHNLPENLWDAITTCWRATPHDRPTFERLQELLAPESEPMEPPKFVGDP